MMVACASEGSFRPTCVHKTGWLALGQGRARRHPPAELTGIQSQAHTYTQDQSAGQLPTGQTVGKPGWNADGDAGQQMKAPGQSNARARTGLHARGQGFDFGELPWEQFALLHDLARVLHLGEDVLRRSHQAGHINIRRRSPPPLLRSRCTIGRHASSSILSRRPRCLWLPVRKILPFTAIAWGRIEGRVGWHTLLPLRGWCLGGCLGHRWHLRLGRKRRRRATEEGVQTFSAVRNTRDTALGGSTGSSHRPPKAGGTQGKHNLSVPRHTGKRA